MNTSKMYFNKFSSGTILALLALSGMLFLVPLAAPVHATNASPLGITVTSGNPVFGGVATEVEFTLSNPATNQYAISSFSITPPSGWTLSSCGVTGTDIALDECSVSGGTADYSALSYIYGTVYELVPGASATLEFVVTPATGVYPFSGTFTTTVQDASSASFYTGPTFSLQVIDSNSQITSANVVVTPGGTNTVSAYTAGTAAYTVTATLTCDHTSDPVNCPTGYENGVSITWSASYAKGTTYSFTPASSTTAGNGEVSTTFQPSNSIYNPSGVLAGAVTLTATAGTSSVAGSPSSGGITTIAGIPSQVGFWLGTTATAFPTTEYLNTEATSTNFNSAYPAGFTGAELLASANVYISATDKFGNPDTFGTSGNGYVIGGTVTIQTASGAVFDASGLPSSVSVANPGTGTTVLMPDNYFQSGVYATAGVLTATISGGTYNGAALSVSGSSGTIQTSTFATTGTFTLTNHVTQLPNSSPTICSTTPTTKTCVAAGKSLAFDYVLSVPQSGVPVTIAVCPTNTCGTTSGYSGTITTASLVTNSSGIATTKLNVDTVAGHFAYLNATVQAPANGNPKANFVTESATNAAPAAITTVAGSAAKFTVVVGVGSGLAPSPITESTPGQTVYVNVVTSDAYGNGVSTVGSEQVQINLVANPSTITVTSAYIPTNCWETNGTSGNGCSSGTNSFGPIAWTLPSTVGSTGTITATGVLNGVTITSATTTITVVSATPTLSVTSPKPVSSIIYSSTPNIQFRGEANASVGYNGAVTMTSLGWKVGSASWQTSSLSGVNAIWSVVATVPTGSSQIQFNATDSKGNVVVSPTFTVFVDSTAPTMTIATPVAGTGSDIVTIASNGDFNESTFTATYGGVTIPSSQISWSGSQTLGTAGTVTATISGLTAGTNTLTVSGQTYTGVTGSASASITITVTFANSITFSTSGATYGAVGAYSGVTVSVTNSWSTSQTIVVFATLKSSTGLYVAQGTVTLAAGQTQSVFAADLLPVPAGTYSVTFSAVTTSNLPVSAPTTPITVTVA